MGIYRVEPTVTRHHGLHVLMDRLFSRLLRQARETEDLFEPGSPGIYLNTIA